ncbi:MAG: outer membrane protein assembly factor BamA, partial [Thermodesulfobacteriota bacterium]
MRKFHPFGTPFFGRHLLAPIVLLTLIFTLLLSFQAVAAEYKQNVAYVPIKVTAPGDPSDLIRQVDEQLSTVLARSGFSLMERQQAEEMIDFQGGWPPSSEDLGKVAQATGYDYVAVGSLTVIGQQLSLDFKLYDLLDPANPRFFYGKGEGLGNLSGLIDGVTGDITRYAGKDFLIASISPKGNKRVDSGLILRKINVKTGDPYDPAALRKDLKEIFNTGYFDDVRIEVEDSREGKRVTFNVIEKAVIQSIVFSGIDELEESEVKEVVTIRNNSTLNFNKLNQATEAIKALYKSKGYYNTLVTPKVTYPEKEMASLRFVIDEGDKIYVKKIAFVGNKSFSDGDLEDVIETSEKGIFSFITESGLMKTEELKQDAARIGAFYNNHGFLKVKLAKPEIRQDGKWLYVTFTIAEGVRYKVGRISFKGDLITDQQTLREYLTIRDEEYLNRKLLRQNRLKITDYYAEQGYAFAEVRANFSKSDVADRVDITIDIRKGELVYINRVTISGNTRTRDNVIRRELKIEEGGIFDSKALRQSSQKLQRLEFFEEVNVTPEPAMDPAKMDVAISVKEKNTGQFSVGVGYSSVDSLLLMGEISENNFLGRGDRMSFQANLSGSTTRFNLGYTNPHLNDSEFSWGIDLFNWDREYDDYDKESRGGALRFGYPLFEKIRWFGSYSYTDTELSNIAEDASYLITQSIDINITSAVKFSLLRDTRDRLAAPSKGSKNLFSVKYAGGPFGGDAQFTKVEGSSSWWFPLFLKTVFHFKAAA